MTIQYNNCSICGKEVLEGASHRGDSYCSPDCALSFAKEEDITEDIKEYNRINYLVCISPNTINFLGDYKVQCLSKEELSRYITTFEKLSKLDFNLNATCKLRRFEGEW